MILYPPGNTSAPIEVEYSTLLTQATRNSHIVRSIKGFRAGKPVLLRLDDHWDTILWFWAILLASGLPVPSPPFSNVVGQRRRHIESLATLLESPIRITRAKSLALFDIPHGMQLYSIESLLQHARPPPADSTALRDSGSNNVNNGPAMLMLTSGSTGNAKAVKLSHRQILAASAAKASVRRLPPDRPFLNWIGLDHVASLVEIHIQALYLGLDQVHVHAADMTPSPTVFLDLLVSATQEETTPPTSPRWDLRDLVILASGGEANDTLVCRAAASLLARHGAPPNVITPGFGMTETCAGAIFNLDCPVYDVEHKHAFTSVGECIKGVEMRVTIPARNGEVVLASCGQPGDLQVRGPVVFDGYYRNEEATAEAFTSDAWFRTGDRAMVDSQGNLTMMSRAKDVVNINGVKVNSADIQVCLDQSVGRRVKYVVGFPSRAAHAHTEQVTVAYVPNESPLPAQVAVDVTGSIVEACLLCTGSRPVVFSLDDESLLPRTTLGKLSRAKMRALFEDGLFSQSVDSHSLLIQNFRLQHLSHPSSEAEASLVADFASTLNLPPDVIGVDTPVFDIGLTSMDLMRLKHRIDCRLRMSVPVVVLMKNPTARSLARALDGLCLEPAVAYDPLVPLRSSGSKTPLWLIHPGVGEVLVFVGLAQQLADDDRPVYALRARGFEPGQPRFGSIAEAVEVYRATIRRRQPKGPYAIAGYSYGSILAFEVAKRLEGEDGAPVPFLGSFNLPPHIKPRMRQLNWNLCLLHLAHFLGLVTEERADSLEDRFGRRLRADAIAQLLSMAHKQRMTELGLNEANLVSWADLAFGLQSMAVDYEPHGEVGAMDVFHAAPLRAAAKSREDWMENHLRKWADFCRAEPRFHEVQGAHYTMIGPDHVASFSKALKAALSSRGV
ncbi:AMP-binding enzyme [Hirsutella rhossiliensis]|uniref:AMP-binding enzyme domain-containing protein n=1 Tax=Hirsutella rhossiliensis TaxID=111463 RepID=A0A9P8SKS7_9HYPO|nr:AMP-binding enzyme domain-containing protein [Hirsutella rhossiliensis]KAH0965090.1 AMP-binding enzyme domain-containing protein [Hirsutella rhossiliensis]